ncbi:MAG: TIGR01620 family protein [Hyphomicrobiaceae bacterium]|nr:TIGR01620 family protein [Hyphomicrobiaceae bacterium]
MSDKPIPPANKPRKPRFFRPGETQEPVQVPEADDRKVAPEPRVHVKAQDKVQAQTQAPQPEPVPAAPTPQPAAALHQPKDKKAKAAEPDPAFEEPAQDEAPGENTSGTIPTLKDIKKGFRWTGIFLSAVGALAVMAFTSWLHSFIGDLMARSDWIGWTTFGLVAIACFALLVIALKELLALRRLKKLGKLREQAERAIKHDERKPAQKVQARITSLFHGRKSLSWGLAGLEEHKDDVLSARDRLILVERNLLVPLDADARKIVADHAKTVSVMTAISPFVFLDMLLVAVQNFKMLRKLMALYGGRPGLFSQVKMVKMMIANLAASGGIAVGADLLAHVMGRQVATRLAGRIGEGLVNGSLTARLGITATKLIRPLPYIEAKPTGIKSFVKELTRGSRRDGSKEAKA